MTTMNFVVYKWDEDEDEWSDPKDIESIPIEKNFGVNEVEGRKECEI